jgi:hypothetical protein
MISHRRPNTASQIPIKIRTSRNGEIIKIRAKINEIETSTKKRGNMHTKINKSKMWLSVIHNFTDEVSC